jgi:hypothetical protein
MIEICTKHLLCKAKSLDLSTFLDTFIQRLAAKELKLSRHVCQMNKIPQAETAQSLTGRETKRLVSSLAGIIFETFRCQDARVPIFIPRPL